MSEESRRTFSLTIHPWCMSPARDEAVRAAEDGRSGPLPTLEKCIERVTERRPPEPRGGGNVTGLRTERVVIEIEHSGPNPIDLHDLAVHLRTRLGLFVGLKRVEEVAIDAGWAERITDERDAAIRERDELRAERITQALTADRFAAAVAEADTLRARVAELQSAAKLAPAANADGESNHAAPAASGAAGTTPLAWGVIEYHGGPIIHATPDEDEAKQYAGDTAPLYAAPQPAKGWLTEKERETLMRISYGLDYAQFATSADFIRSFLARSSPPQVVPPEQEFRSHSNALRDAEWFAALASAGVAVKEVGSE